MNAAAERALQQRALANPVRQGMVQKRQEMNAARAAARRAAGVLSICEEEDQKPHPLEPGTTYRFNDTAWVCEQTRGALSPSLLGATVQLKKNGGDQGTCKIVAVNQKGLTCKGILSNREIKGPDYDAFTIMKLKAGGRKRKTRKQSKRFKRTRRSRS